MSEYRASATELGFDLHYPPEFEESIAWQDQDIEAGGDGFQLAFLRCDEILRWLATARTCSRTLVPFARGGDNADGLWCFDASDQGKVFVINLGDRKRRATQWSSGG